MTSEPATADDPRWARILARDAGADGSFWYSVVTTGVYCRPSCSSRAARPANVTIHDTLDAARAVARACRRCNPDGASLAARNAALVERACRRLERSETVPPLAALADEAEMSPAYFHRLFKAATGLTPRGYAAACRAVKVRDELRDAGSVTAAIHAAGYGSSGRFYAESRDILGMAPARYRDGGRAESLRVAVADCALGKVLVAATDRGVAAIQLGDDADALMAELRGRFPAAELLEADERLREQLAQVVALVETPAINPDLPLDVRGTAFQQRVWAALRAIPPGETATYAQVAQAIGAPTAARAVAGACAANRLALAIPCHRVVPGSGGTGGYRWGAARKRALLDRERQG
jgi:AraC family transcriptional regulator of adaptative response/methylated-DNA-[protein]-cysteine methyltransferase